MNPSVGHTETNWHTNNGHEHDSGSDRHKCVCGRDFGTAKRMKIHRTKMKCVDLHMGQRNEGQPSDETAETPGPVENHSAERIQATCAEDTNSVEQRSRIKFPKSSDKVEWEKLDKELSKHLIESLPRNTTKRIEAFGGMVYAYCADRFGCVGKRQTPKTQPKSRRQKELESVRNEKNRVRRLWRNATNEIEKQGLKELWSELKKRHSILRKAENVLRKKRELRKSREQFFKDPFRYAKNLFQQPRSGKLEVNKEELEAHLKKTYADPNKDEPLAGIEGVDVASAPRKPFNTNPPTLFEVEQALKKSRAKSAPGPNGVPYLVYKKCPEVSKLLHLQIHSAWQYGIICEEWQKANGVYIPKESESKAINQFRPISPLNVEGKLFFAILAKRITKYLLENGYVDTTIQKGGIPQVSGCLEHASMIWSAIQAAKTRKLDLHVIWLDLANAYGSVPHSAIWKALEMLHFPNRVVTILKTYFGNFNMRFTTETYTTEYVPLQTGIAMGCSVSPILFVLAMQMLLKATEAEAKTYNLSDGQDRPALKAFMDDTTIISNSVEGCDAALQRFNKLIEWCRMKLKPTKSRSLSITKGKVDESVKFTVAGHTIPTVSEQPVKSLGRWYDSSLKDTQRSSELEEQAIEGLETINKTKLPGKFKVWILQFVLIPKLLWPLLVYDIPSSLVERLEKKVSKYIRKWFGLPPGLSTSASFADK